MDYRSRNMYQITYRSYGTRYSTVILGVNEHEALTKFKARFRPHVKAEYIENLSDPYAIAQPIT